MKYISNIIGGTISQKFNEEIFRDKYLFKYKGKCEPLSLLHYLYMKGYLEFKRILMEHIAKCNEKIRIISFNYLYNHKYDYYTYERIIYALSKIYIDQSYLKKTLNDFGIIVAYISEHFDYKENIFLLMLFNHFINKYSLFFCEIINPADIGPYIFSSKTIERLPVFFQLPKIPAIPILDRYINIEFEPANTEFNISIKNTINVDISGTISTISKYLTSNIYRVKNELGYDFSQQDAELISIYIDSYNKHNQESDFSDRLIGLYLWDMCYRTTRVNKLSERSAIDNFIKLYKNNPAIKQKSLRQYQRILRETKKSIETFSYLPLS